MIDKIKHSMNCGITLKDTFLVENENSEIQKICNELGYQIIECSICGKRYFLFRDNGNSYIEEDNTDNIEQILLMYNNIKDFSNLKDKNSNLIFYSNIENIINYPLGINGANIIIYRAIDKNTGEDYNGNLN